MPRRNRIPKDRLGRHVRIMEFMLASGAWQSLDPVARALYVEMARRYRGPNSNNAKIPYSVREAAVALKVSRNTSNRPFHHLEKRAFILPHNPRHLHPTHPPSPAPPPTH